MSTSEHDAPFESAEERLILWQRATPRADHTDEQAASFTRKVRTRMEVAGGEALAASGNAVGASFDGMELPDVIELALGIAQDAAEEAAAIEVACGIAYGPVQSASTARASKVHGAAQGAAIDRAQLLAYRADAGETALDEATAQQAEAAYLFTRELRAGSVLGRVLDPTFDRRACRAAVERLLEARWPEPEPPSSALLLQLLRSGYARVLLGSALPHVALDHIARARAALQPSFVLHAVRDGAGLAPLSSLAVALRRVWSEIAALPLPAPAREVLEQLRTGRAVGRTEAGAALGVLLRAARGEAAPWLVLERVRELDPPSLLVIGDLLSDASVPCSLIATTDEGTQAPPALLRTGAPESILAEPLDETARLQAAASMLGLSVTDSVPQRVAELGGESVLAIREAARALISTGDVVHDGSRFRFRASERRAVDAATPEELVLARAGGLPSVAHRVLEAICIAPVAADRAFTCAVAELDGVPSDAQAAGFEQLVAERFLDAQGGLGPLEGATRFAMRAAMPPARAAELHRFVARVLREQGHSQPNESPAFIAADIAHHLAEGGNEAEAARALLEAAEAAHGSGFDRVAVRLAALALKLDGSRDMRDGAARLAKVVGTRAETDPLHDTSPGMGDKPAQAPRPSQPSVQAALRAILARDSETADGALDTAVTMGLGRAAAGRLAALAQLSKGDIPEAVRALKRTRVTSAGGISATKQSLTAALILLEAGHEVDAVRSALEALASARRAGEARGEHASRLVLGGCYRRLGRVAEAELIEAVG